MFNKLDWLNADGGSGLTPRARIIADNPVIEIADYEAW